MEELNIIIPTLESALTLSKTIECLKGNFNLYIVDGSSLDETVNVAKKYKAEILITKANRGLQLSKGGEKIKDGWMLFLHSDTVLVEGAFSEIERFIKSNDARNKVGYFSLKFDDESVFAKIVQFAVNLRCKFFSLPYGDQGLLIHKSYYDMIGGFNPLPIMEDVDLISRINNKNISLIPSTAITSSKKYKKNGYIFRVVKNVTCLILFKINIPIKYIKFIYDI